MAKNPIKEKEIAWRFLMLNDDGSELNSHGKTIIADLKNFCRGADSVYSDNALEMARLAGRQEVFQRIMKFMELNLSKQYTINEEFYEYD